MSYAYRRVITRENKRDTLTARAWARYELGNLLAREEYARIGTTIDSRYGDGPVRAVTSGVVVSLPSLTRPESSLGQEISLGWSA